MSVSLLIGIAVLCGVAFSVLAAISMVTLAGAADDREDDFYASIDVPRCARCGRILRTEEDLMTVSCGVCRGLPRAARLRGDEITHARSAR